MKLCLISDTHNRLNEINLPSADILIHAGDATIKGSIPEIEQFIKDLRQQSHKFSHIIFIAGNHDWLFETYNRYARELLGDEVIYLQDSSVEIEKLKIYGSPWQPRFFDWAFNLNRGREIAEKWKLIPLDTDILITHGPPHGILDETPRGDWAGCEELRKKVEKVKPKLHVFGHIHYAYGKTEKFGTTFVNASNCDESYEPINLPIVIDL